jgi:hypothetical protein
MDEDHPAISLLSDDSDTRKFFENPFLWVDKRIEQLAGIGHRALNPHFSQTCRVGQANCSSGGTSVAVKTLALIHFEILEFVSLH